MTRSSRHSLVAIGTVLCAGAIAAPPVSTVLYTQNGRVMDGGIPSQNFETQLDRDDSRAADDFVVPKGRTWAINEVDAIGAYFGGTGPVDSANVTFYANAGGLPGAIVKDYEGLHVTDTGGGALEIRVPKTKLKAGTYWVSVQANMDLDKGGEWAWKSQDTSVGLRAAWENPGDGFATGCTTYTAEPSCIVGFGDHLFTLKGKAK